MRKLYLIYSNHIDKSTTNSFIEYFKDFFSPIELILTDKIEKNETNIIIDEFTNKEFVSEIKSTLKYYKDTKIILVFTEYFNQKGYKIFNNFDLSHKQIILFEIINFLYDFLYTIYKNLKKSYLLINQRLQKKLKKNQSEVNFEKPGNFARLIKSIVAKSDKLFVCFDTYIYNLNESLRKKLGKSYENFKYFKKRYKGFIKVKKSISSYLIWNEDQRINLINNGIDNSKIISIFPYVNKISNKNNHGISISGEVTTYRVDSVKRLKRDIFILNNFEEFLFFKSNFYFKKQFFSYSINPKKELNWVYPSLFRYIFSINKNEIPIISDDFNCPVTNLLTLKLGEDITINEINDENCLIGALSKINSKISHYIKDIYLPSKKNFHDKYI